MSEEPNTTPGNPLNPPTDRTNTGSNSTTKPEHPPTEIPLHSPQRTEPIHSQLIEIKLSPHIPSKIATNATGATNATNATDTTNAPLTTLNPVSLQPFTTEELRVHKLESLLSQYPTPEAAIKARDDTAAELRKMLDENERRNREIEREMEEKEKTREIERKVYAKKVGKDA